MKSLGVGVFAEQGELDLALLTNGTVLWGDSSGAKFDVVSCDLQY
jgi:hypothetical protein